MRSKRPINLITAYLLAPVLFLFMSNTAQAKKRLAEQVGGEAYWILPAPRELSPSVFGTPDNPKKLVDPYVQQAKDLVSEKKMPPSVPDLIDPNGPMHGLPLLVGLPMDGPWGRSMVNGKWTMKHGSPFGDKMMPLKGEDHYFRAKFFDNQLTDAKGKTFLDTDDKVAFVSEFTDPQGNHYKVQTLKAFKPPMPGWETQGGVMMNGEIGGNSGTFIPLIPRAKTHAAFWAIGKITVNDKQPVTHVVVFYITEDIRNSQGQMALDEDMPLNSQGMQAHLLVPPIKPVPGVGPTKKPVPTAFKLPPKAPKDFQPFISIYFPNPEFMESF